MKRGRTSNIQHPTSNVELKELLSDGETWRKMAEGAREMWRREFDLDKNTEQFKNILNRRLVRRSPALAERRRIHADKMSLTERTAAVAQGLWRAKESAERESESAEFRPAARG